MNIKINYIVTESERSTKLMFSTLEVADIAVFDSTLLNRTQHSLYQKR